MGRKLTRLILTVLLLCSSANKHLYAEGPPTAKNVLILYSFSDRTVVEPAQALESEIRSRVPGPINFYVEYMEAQRFANEEYQQSLSESLRLAYAGTKLSAVVVHAYPALQFAMKFRERIFPGTPIVFWEVHQDRVGGKSLGPGVTGVTLPIDYQGTLGLALKLHSGTANVAVVTGNSESETYWLQSLRNEIRSREEKLDIVELINLPTAELFRRVSQLPEHTIIIFQVLPRDSSQPSIGIYDEIAAVSQRVPTYCAFPRYCVDHGGIGGSFFDHDEQRRTVGYLAARVLAGEKPENISIVHSSKVRNAVDWRQLRRWNIPESALPPGTVVLFRPPTAWERHHSIILAGAILILLQALLIGALLWQRANRKKYQARLADSEERFRVMAENAPALIWTMDRDRKCTYANKRTLEFCGVSAEDITGLDVFNFIHRDDRDRVENGFQEAHAKHQKFSTEYRSRRYDKEYRWMLGSLAPQFSAVGSVDGYVGCAIDVTDQNNALESLEKLGGQLINAQENERCRIARELHDDICQRLAVLSIELEQAAATDGRIGAERSALFEEAIQHCSEITGDVQALSHELHSSKLEYLGLASALKGFCGEFAAQHGVDVDFTQVDIPENVSYEVSLCLFRVAQEALRNALKHSGASQFAVHSRGVGNEIELLVQDQGRGFIPDSQTDRGLGITSMRERMHLVNGSLSVESKPGIGTTILAIAPVGKQVKSDLKTPVASSGKANA